MKDLETTSFERKEPLLRFKKIEENYKSSLEHINKCLVDTKYPELQALTKLFLETDVNPYSFLPEYFAPAFDTAGGLSSLLGTIHHALYDDGDISFPVVNGEPRIVFANLQDSDYEDAVLNETERYFKKERGNRYVIGQCKDTLDFTKRFDSFHSKQVKNWFIDTAARFGVEFSVKHYCHSYSQFDPEWEFDESILSEIEVLRSELVKLNIIKGN